MNNAAIYWGTGRRKEAVARVRLVPGSGQLTINDRPGDEYLHFRQNLITYARQPLETLGLEGAYDVLVNVFVLHFTTTITTLKVLTNVIRRRIWVTMIYKMTIKI